MRIKLTVFILFLICVPIKVKAATTLYQTTEKTQITRGVTYEKTRAVTADGLLDVHILRLPLNDPNIKVQSADSLKEFGLKETVRTILNDNNAIAGVNGDFFGVAGDYSIPFGPVFKDGELLSVSSGFNKDKNELSSFYLDQDNNPFILYLKVEIDFLNDGKENMEVYSVNKITDMVFPVLVTSDAMKDTSSVDKRFGGVLKIVVENNKITYVSNKGETVKIPENGYVVLIGNDSADYFKQFYKAGQSAQVVFRAGIDFNKIKMAIGGAGRILLNGETVHDTGTVIAGRQPRTAIGISKNNLELIIMTVDGRSHSIGATQDEIADLLRKAGAYNAMHLDGGTSSAMGVKFPGSDNVQIVNTLPENYERKVINTLGIFNVAPAGNMTKLVVEPESKLVFKGVPVKMNIYGTDDYLRKMQVDLSGVVFNTNDPGGRWENDLYYPGMTGKINILASYNNIPGECIIEARQLAEISTTKTVKLIEGENTNLIFKGIAVDGSEGYVGSGIEYRVFPETLGHMQGGTFIADSSGKGFIQCKVGDVTTYVEVFVGGTVVPLLKFDGSRALEYKCYPAGIGGSVGVSKGQAANDQPSARLTYKFNVADDVTQAAYMVFSEPFTISGEAIGLKLYTLGDESGNWLRGRIIDADGNSFYIDFAKKIDWSGWKEVQAVIPAGVKYPVALERIYVASLTCGESIERSLYFFNLSGVYQMDETPLMIPPTNKYKDLLNVSLNSAPANGSFDITLVGDMMLSDKKKPDNYQNVQNAALKLFNKDSSRGLFCGETDIPIEGNVPIYQWNPNYIMHNEKNAAIIQMTASKGSLWKSNQEQWTKFSMNILDSQKDLIIVELDVNPFKLSEPREFELFHDELAKLRKVTGAVIFVVSTDGTATTNTVKDGIRYINMGSLWTNDKQPNPEFRVLRFRVTGKEISYELQEIAW